MSYILTFDVGTTAVKTCLFSGTLDLRASYTSEYALSTPSASFVELAPEIYWDAVKAGVSHILASGIKPDEIDIAAIVTQGETLIPVDKNGRALCNAIVWLDTRAGDECIELLEKLGQDYFYHTTGLAEITPATPVCKLLWIKNKRPELFRKTHRFLLVEDYLLFRLTGEFATEPSLLASTGYFDINNNRYDRRILGTAGVDEGMLCRVAACGTVIGKVTSLAASETSLRAGMSVCSGAMDQIASALGSGNINPGIVTETTGTCLAVAATIEEPDYSNPFRPYVYKHFNDKFLYLPYNPAGAIILKWFKDELMALVAKECGDRGVPVYTELDRIAAAVPPGSGGLMVLPHFAGKLVPKANARVKGVLLGVGLESRPAHFIRAILEGIGYMLRENVAFLENCGIKAREIRSLGGGSNSSLWNTIKADICGRNIVTMKQNESTSLGAAILGALAMGYYANADEICGSLQPVKVYTPNPDNKSVYDDGYKKYLELYERLADMF